MDGRWAIVSLLLAGCSLHPSNNGGGAINLAVAGEWVIVARGESGIDVLRAATGERVGGRAPDGESDSYDDVASDGTTLLALDADDGRLTSLAVGPGGSLDVVTDDLPVEVGPYSGVSLGGGRAVVSGGTSPLTLLSVDGKGALAKQGSLERYRGLPDAVVLPDGRGALLSTHFSGSSDEFVDGQEFGVSTISLSPLAFVDARGLDGGGFTPGGGTPASWAVRADVRGDLAAVAHGGGLDLFRIDAGLALKRAGRLSLPFSAVAVALDGDRAYVVGASPPSLAEVDVSDVAAPRLVATVAVSGADASPTAVVVVGDRVYVAAGAPEPEVFQRPIQP